MDLPIDRMARSAKLFNPRIHASRTAEDKHLLDLLLPPGLDALTGAALLGVSFLGSFITAAFGIGGGIVVLAALASLLPPPALVPIHAVVQLGSNTGRALVMREHIHKGVFVSFAAGTVVGIAIGGAVVIDLPPAVLQMAVGAFILWTIFARPPAILRRAAWLAGGISSFLTMFFGATGSFVSAYIRSNEFDRLTYTGTHAMCMTLQHGLKVVAFGVLGFAFAPYLPLVLGMIVLGFIGTVIGRRVLMKADEARFQKILNIVLGVLAVRLIWAGASTYL